MADQFRDSCVSRQSKDRGLEDPIRVSFYDKDGTAVNEITRKEANCIAQINPSQVFYFMDGNGYQRELPISGVNALTKQDQLSTAPSCPSNPQLCGPPKVEFLGGNGLGAVANVIVSPISSSVIGFDFKSRGFNFTDAPLAQIVDDCGTGSGASLQVQMQPYGTSRASARTTTGTAAGGTASAATGAAAGGATGIAAAGTAGASTGTAAGGVTGATAGIPGLNTIPQTPNSLNEILNYAGLSDLNSLTNLTGISNINNLTNITNFNNLKELLDLFGIFGNSQRFGQEIKNIIVRSPGDEYLASPNGSLGGNGRVWKGPNDGYVITKDGQYYIVPGEQPPVDLPPGDTYIPPQPPSPEVLPEVLPPTTVTLPPDVVVPKLPAVDPNIPSVPTYPVVIDIEEVYVDDPGFGYQPGDTMTVVPDKGAIVEPVINDRGEIEKVNVINPGIGFVDMPEIFIDSETGYNAKLIPILRATPLNEIPDPTVLPLDTQLITVVDCVGKIAPKSEFDLIPR